MSWWIAPFSAEHELRRRIGKGRVVATMNLRMAVETPASLRVVDPALAAGGRTEQRPVFRQFLVLASELRDVTAMRRVALVAQEGRPQLEHAVGYGAVWVVADGTVFGHGAMVVHERPTLLRVALVTGVHHAIALHQRAPDRTVWIMTVRAGNLAFENRMAEGAVHLGALLLVAGETHLGLRDLRQHLVGPVHGVATDAGCLAHLVSAAFPMSALAASGMAREADPVLVFGRDHLAAQASHPAHAPAATGLDVLGRIAVTGRTAAGVGRSAKIALLPVYRALVVRDDIRVAPLADFRIRNGSRLRKARRTKADQCCN